MSKKNPNETKDAKIDDENVVTTGEISDEELEDVTGGRLSYTTNVQTGSTFNTATSFLTYIDPFETVYGGGISLQMDKLKR